MFSPQLAAMAPESDADAYQDAILPKVSRTFALTIPELPPALRRAVANEDEPAFSAEEKRCHEDAFIGAVTGSSDPQHFARDIAPRFSDATSEAERELMAQLPRVLQVTRSLAQTQQDAIVRCLQIMSHGMHDFQRNAGTHGLATLRDMDCYCYCVAGVVGEMLTELLVDADPALSSQKDHLMRLAISFGQGLQMTNILKDQWEDYQRGACWLPRDVFERHGVRLDKFQQGPASPGHQAALRELIGVAHAHLRDALAYALAVPARQAGYRRFCLWSIGLALLTLDRLNSNLDFSAGQQVKISRRAVGWTIMLTRLSGHFDTGLRGLFALAARRLPLTPLSAEWQAPARGGLIWPKTAMTYFTGPAGQPFPEISDLHP